MEEIVNDENFLDEPMQNAIGNRDEGFCDEDEIESDEDDVEIIQAIDEELEDSDSDSDSDLTENNKTESEYWIHEKVSCQILNNKQEPA